MPSQNKIIYLALSLILLFPAVNSCKNKTNDTDQKQQMKPGCDSLTSKKFIVKFADSIIERGDNDFIWNLSEVDSSRFFTTENYFTNTKIKDRLVFIGGSAGLSAGTANNLALVFSCSDTFKLVWAGQVGEFTASDIRDLNNDGITDIICKTEAVWMGECSNSFTIFNFKGGKQNFLFAASSSSMIGCGMDNLTETFKKGDTLEVNYDCSLYKRNDEKFIVQEIRTIKIHNGGKDDEEVQKNLLIKVDTLQRELR